MASPGPTAAPEGGRSRYVRGPGKNRVVVFVNGVFGDSVSTWMNAESGAYWPDLLAGDPEFAESDIYVYDFQSPKLGSAQEILELAGRLKNYLDAKNVIRDHSEIVFVCHSMGGLVVRAYLLDARIPPGKLAFLFFLGTPTAGANVAEIAMHLSANPQLDNMQPLGPDTYVKTLRERWLRASDDPGLDYPRKVSSYCAYEVRPTYGFKIVPELSATYLCNRSTTAIQANHLDIVKPKDRDDEIYVALLAAYKNQLGAAAPVVRMAVAEARPGILAGATAFRIADLSTAKIALRQTQPTPEAIEAPCGRVREGELTVASDLAPGETVSEVHPEVVEAFNLSSSSAVVVRFDGRTAVIAYRLEGSCPAGGRARVAVNFVTSNRRSFPRAAREFVRPGMLRVPTDAVSHAPAGAAERIPAGVAGRAAAVVAPSPPRGLAHRVRGGAVLVPTPAP
jgi:pimeloyl-ACP methyl ester carboxylesterase